VTDALRADAVRYADAGEIEIAYEAFGDPGDPPVLLIMGLATQMLGWHEEFCAALAERGLFVIRFDNRDSGLSTHLHDAPRVEGGAPYTLSDMARDTVGLIEALGLERAHLVGVSLGGMIAQTVAIEHPERVLSLTSIMSTTGDPAVTVPTEEALAVLLQPPPRGREEAIERAVANFAVIGSPGFEPDEAWLRERAALSYDRAFDPPGVARQLAAVRVSEDRTARLRELRVPALVMHGADDPLIPVAAGRATAAAIPDAELVVFDGMGHDLPRQLWPEMIERIVALARTGPPV
jgi:pimeloyl-ACP methyl ester carboxylesterase